MLTTLSCELLSLIYDYIPVINKKLCHHRSLSDYYQLYLPKCSSDWNIEYIKNHANIKKNILFFTNLETYAMIIHNIYTEIVQHQLESFFYFLNLTDENSEIIYDIISEHCPFGFNYFNEVSEYHLIIINCLSDVFNGFNYSKWLIQPEKKIHL